MPAMYERIRDKLIAEGVSEKEAKRRAAAAYNKWAKKAGKKPVTGKHRK